MTKEQLKEANELFASMLEVQRTINDLGCLDIHNGCLVSFRRGDVEMTLPEELAHKVIAMIKDYCEKEKSKLKEAFEKL